ncbi:hypothetical protein ASG41_12035 [Modestobacter sp. Leaf380]|nr:hypothetical protein ASG41_12035 [Modestobacter sp. Leaf380]
MISGCRSWADDVAERDLVVVGASAGGVEALRAFVAGLPADLPAAVLVVLHVPANGGSALANVLSRSCALPVTPAVQDQELVRGTVTVAVPDRHLLVAGERLVLSRGPRENGHRPAVDPLFRSAAQVSGPRTLAVVLSGTLDDGAAGALAVERHGGVVVVQDPADALYDSMPRAALQATLAARSAPADQLGALVAELVGQPVPEPVDPATTSGTEPDRMRLETAMAAFDEEALGSPDRPGDPAGLTCPDCAGPLFSIPEETLQRYRCRVGHAWTAQSLAAEQTSAVEGALWMALRSLEEKADLARSMGTRAAARGHTLTAGRFVEQADEAHTSALLLRQLLQRASTPQPDGELEAGA